MSLADNILVLRTGNDNILHKFANGLNDTRTYPNHMGAKLAEGKSIHFANKASARE